MLTKKILTAILVFAFNLSTVFSQYEDYTQFSLPEDAKVRFGKGGRGEVKYSPGGDIIAVGSRIGIWLYDATSGEELSLLTDHTSKFDTFVFRQGGITLTSASYNGIVYMWDPITGVSHQIPMEHKHDVHGCSFSPDGSIIAGIIESKEDGGYGEKHLGIQLWDTITGERRATLLGHTKDVEDIVFSPDGRILASSSKDNTIRLWDVFTGTLHQILIEHIDSGNDIVFSPDGRILASSSKDNTIRLWDVFTGTLHQILIEHIDSGNDIVFSPDGRILASSSKDNTIRLWNVETGLNTRTITEYTDNIRDIVFSPDGMTLACGIDGGMVGLWDIGTGVNQGTIIGQTDTVNRLVFSPDGKTIASGGSDGTIHLWDINTKEFHLIATGHTAAMVEGFLFHPDGTIFTCEGGHNTLEIQIWGTDTGSYRQTLIDHPYYTTCHAFRPDGQLIATGGWKDNIIRLWDVETGKYKGALTGHTKGVQELMFSPDGKFLASGSEDNTIRLWDVETGTSVHTLSGYKYTPDELAFSPDSRRLAGGSGIGGTLFLWDVATGKRLRKFISDRNLYSITCIAFAPDGKTLTIGSLDEIVLWEVTEGSPYKIIKDCQLDQTSKFAFSPDGNILATSGLKESSLWDITTGQRLKKITGHAYYVAGLAFSPDGTEFVSSGWGDGTVILWDIPKIRERWEEIQKWISD